MRTHVLSRLMALESSGKHLPASTPLSLCAPNAVRPAKKQKTSTDHDYLYNYIDFIVNLYYQTIKKKNGNTKIQKPDSTNTVQITH